MEKPRILIVDDESEARETLGRYLNRHMECEIFDAPDGRKALEILKTGNIDLMILDIKMPGISGVDVLRQAKDVSSKTQAIIVSAWDSRQVASEAIKEGAADYIIKPSTISVIFERISVALKSMNKFFPKSN
ncbi:MAG: response regulator [Candidatus Omnitrophica bacterium]|nr:response regulator [Candidatus Omnitrophota bacterium]